MSRIAGRTAEEIEDAVRGTTPSLVLVTDPAATGPAAFPLLRRVRIDHPSALILHVNPAVDSFAPSLDVWAGGYDAAVRCEGDITEEALAPLRARRRQLCEERAQATARRVVLLASHAPAWEAIAAGLVRDGFEVHHMGEEEMLGWVRSGPVPHILLAQHDLSDNLLDTVLAVQRFHAEVDCYAPVIEADAQAALMSLAVGQAGNHVEAVDDDGLGEFVASAWIRWMLGPQASDSVYRPGSDHIALVVDDDPAVRSTVMLALSRDSGLKALGVGSMEGALARLADGDVDVVLVRLGLPDAPQIQSVLRLRVGRPSLPVLVLADEPAGRAARVAVMSGAQDVLPRASLDPFLVWRVRDACYRSSQLARAEGYAVRLEEAERRLRDLNGKLRTANGRLEDLASHDPLTGLLNRRGLEDVLLAEQARAARGGTPVLAALVDIDDFKVVNDEYGHHVGDEVLRRVAALLCTAVRPSDHCSRIGGDEFVVIFPDADSAGAEEMADRLRTAVGESAVLGGEEPVHVSVSIGVGELAGTDLGLDDVLVRLRPGLHRSKDGGKNSVELVAPSIASPG